MYKFFTLFASLAIALYFLGDPLLSIIGTKCSDQFFWYCNIPQYLAWTFSVLSGITLLIGIFQQFKQTK